MVNITEAILFINPLAKFSCVANIFSSVVYADDYTGKKPTLAECEAAWAEIQSLPQHPTTEERLVAIESLLPILAEIANV